MAAVTKILAKIAKANNIGQSSESLNTSKTNNTGTSQAKATAPQKAEISLPTRKYLNSRNYVSFQCGEK